MNVEANSGRSVGSQDKNVRKKINKRKYLLIKRRRKIKKIRFWLFCKEMRIMSIIYLMAV